jgi:hypothetical protein
MMNCSFHLINKSNRIKFNTVPAQAINDSYDGLCCGEIIRKASGHLFFHDAHILTSAKLSVPRRFVELCSESISKHKTTDLSVFNEMNVIIPS